MCPMSLIIETKKYSRVLVVKSLEKIRKKSRTEREGIGIEEVGAGNSKEKVGHGGARGEEDTSRVGI